MAAYVAFGAGLMAILMITAANISDGASLPLTAADTVYTVPASLAYVFPALIGTMAVTAEYRHQTLTPTFLAEPRRVIVLGAKMIASLPMGLAYGIVGGVFAVGTGAAVLAIGGLDTGLSDPHTFRNTALGAITLMLWTAIGVGFGALVRNQVAAIVILLGFNQLIEPVLRMIPMMTGHGAHLTQFLPGAAGEALSGGSGILGLDVSMQTLPPWAGALTMLGYALVFALIGYAVSFRRDVS
jgi:hypothetical protein